MTVSVNLTGRSVLRSRTCHPQHHARRQQAVEKAAHNILRLNIFGLEKMDYEKRKTRIIETELALGIIKQTVEILKPEKKCKMEHSDKNDLEMIITVDEDALKHLRSFKNGPKPLILKFKAGTDVETIELPTKKTCK